MATNQVQRIRDARGDREQELKEYDKYVESMEAKGQKPKALKDLRK